MMPRNYFPKGQLQRAIGNSLSKNQLNRMNNSFKIIQNPFQKHSAFKQTIDISMKNHSAKGHQNITNYQLNKQIYQHYRPSDQMEQSCNYFSMKHKPFKNSDSDRNVSNFSNSSFHNKPNPKQSPYTKVYAFQSRRNSKPNSINRSYQKFKSKIYSSYQPYSNDSNLERALLHSPFHQFGVVQSSQRFKSNSNKNSVLNSQIKYLNNPFEKKRLLSYSVNNQNEISTHDYDYPRNHNFYAQNYNKIYNQEFFSEYKNYDTMSIDRRADTSSNVQKLSLTSNKHNMNAYVDNQVLTKDRSMTQRNAIKDENTMPFGFQSASFKLGSRLHIENSFQNDDYSFNNALRTKNSQEIKYASKRNQKYDSERNSKMDDRSSNFSKKQNNFQRKQSMGFSETGRFPQVIGFENKQYQLAHQL